jgi:NADPH-dependent ferric siderophore reductase
MASSQHSAKILESLESGGYTYMKVQEGKDDYWIAMTQRAVKVGETIEYTEQGWMKDFHSKTLNRTFDNILFAGDKTATPAMAALEKIAPNVMSSKYQEKGTISIAELFANRDKYAGKEVVVKGKVAKTSVGIMRLNWVHIKDGSNFANMDDLVFTSTQDVPKDGEVVYAKGIVVKDKDFGYGYFYPLIIQEAHFSK